MLYAIVKKDAAQRAGINPGFHRLDRSQTLMAVNENELRHVDPDIEKAAARLGGKTCSLSELSEKMKDWQ